MITTASTWIVFKVKLDLYRAYGSKNKELPEKIIIYRDGVGTGDIARILETEVASAKVSHNTNYHFVLLFSQ